MSYYSDPSPEQFQYLMIAVVLLIGVVLLWAYGNYEKHKKTTKHTSKKSKSSKRKKK